MELDVIDVVRPHNLTVNDLDMFGDAMRKILDDPDSTEAYDLKAWLANVKRGLLEDDRYKDLNDLKYVEDCNGFEIDITFE